MLSVGDRAFESVYHLQFILNVSKMKKMSKDSEGDEMKFALGIDVGSTTIKMVVVNEQGDMIYDQYTRHHANVQGTLVKMMQDVIASSHLDAMPVVMTGSGGLAYAKHLSIPFVQEVIACSHAVETLIPQTDVAIELGGEDAKITYFTNGLDQRMNGTCAGGTGAFIDQMAALLQTDAMGLNELAKDYQVIYPIAARCGVFAKTDIQPLINEGASKADLAASIFQAVVNQTIGGLAWGRPIKGKVALLGGPLSFLTSLQDRFIDTLGLDQESCILPPNAQYFVALGCALQALVHDSLDLRLLAKGLEEANLVDLHEQPPLKPLFESNEAYDEFKARYQTYEVEKAPLETHVGPIYLGIDAGSTTTKMVLMDNQYRLLDSFYQSNQGDPLSLCVSLLKQIYEKLPKDAYIASSGITGYGEGFIQKVLKVDIGEVETIAHYKAANHFLPGVEFILDIGGQDMKAIKIKDGVIQNILLNEACSSGCGSFIESFATSLKVDLPSFIDQAIQSTHPVDLGSRCTVFMNSKVKQAQKEGSSVGDIFAGLSYAVIKNALFKVIKMKSQDEIGDKVVVQGGTFYNDAVLRSFEIVSGIKPVRPDIAGLMGAYGAAMLALEKAPEVSTLLSLDELDFSSVKHFDHCNKCMNRCLLTITELSDGRTHISGNRCERGLGMELSPSRMPNLYQIKYQRMFDRPVLRHARRGKIGLLRTLNMYDNYPFWHAFFTKLEFEVVLSRRSSKALYEKGMATIPSESVCYPAKLAHGHMVDLVERKIDTIFYPSIVFERKETDSANNHYNCPIVTSYPEVLKNNVDLKGSTLINPFLNFNDSKAMFKQLSVALASYNLSSKELKEALNAGYEALDQFQYDMQKEALAIMEQLEQTGKQGIVLAGRPYHLDNEIHHGIDQLIVEQGFAVLTEDAVAGLSTIENPLRVVDQWTYHGRLYRAANYVASHPNLELVQLTSFGCGLDAVTTEEVMEILERHHKVHTLLKIDEVSNLGAIKIRIRSLKAALEERVDLPKKPPVAYQSWHLPFTKEMKKTHTILAPQMSPIHFQFFESAFAGEGYNLVVLDSMTSHGMDQGLKFVNNDACYPSIIVIGQLLEAIQSGAYDTNHLSVLISQTGGGCRATNYIAFLRKALKDAGYGHIPVISLNALGLEKNPGFSLSVKVIRKLLMGIVYGDLLMRVLYRTRPYEAVEGSANVLYDSFLDRINENVKNGSMKQFKALTKEIVIAFDHLPLNDTKKPRVGVVGEILVKFHPDANNDLVDTLEQLGAEAVMPDLLGFFLYSAFNNNFKYEYLGGKFLTKTFSNVIIWYIEQFKKAVDEALEESQRFEAPWSIQKMAEKAQPLLSIGNQTGEGWFLTAEMIELAETDVPNILCLQPFACLPNHVVGKGMNQVMKNHYPHVNLAMIDYDPGASESNQLNRIQLMLQTAVKQMKA